MSDLPYHLRPGAPQRRVVCAANRLVDHPLCIVIGPRHHDPVMREQIRAFIEMGGGYAIGWRSSEQGFIDQWGTFMDRREAFAVAKAAGQVLYGPHLPDGELDSSDLY